LQGSVASALPWNLVPAVIGPIVETVVFYLVFKVVHTNGRSTAKYAVYILIMALLGWLLHGASWQSVNRLVGFAIFAALYARWAKEGSLPAFAVTAWAHIVANSSIFAVVYFRG
jgi:hypothetical protein